MATPPKQASRELDQVTFTAALDAFDVLPGSADLSVNASPSLITDPSFTAILLAAGKPLDRLSIETTEHARVADYLALRDALEQLRAHGVRFAIDDTGAGYASLSHVIQLRPDVIKLDRNLISSLDEDRARRALVTALVMLALEIGATVTGEGVETAAQLDILATLGVDHVQGFYLAKPTTDQTAWQTWSTRPWPGPTPAGRSSSPRS